ncbi:hypothetical protein [Cryptosporangium minutisporangium]|uniref:Uncharacterized protein n=1 Tax=Cryptosporangium minutisporangium TaxID=113569 RepID=A0ABP6SVV3_9ACTN
MDDRRPPPRPIGPGDPVPHSELRPGRLIARWTDNLRSRQVRVPLPCHERQTVTANPRRPLAGVVVCRVCSRTFDLELTDDNDGGYTAWFTVAYRPFLLSRAAPARARTE